MPCLCCCCPLQYAVSALLLFSKQKTSSLEAGLIIN